MSNLMSGNLLVLFPGGAYFFTSFQLLVKDEHWVPVKGFGLNPPRKRVVRINLSFRHNVRIPQLFSMDVKQEINPKAFIYTLTHSFYCCLIWSLRRIDYKSHPGARGRYRHNGLRMNTAHDVTDITCHVIIHIVGSFTKPRTCTLVNFTGETKNFLDWLLFVTFLWDSDWKHILSLFNGHK